MEIFTRFNTLWQRDRDEELKEFLASVPRVSEFEAKIKFYESLATDIDSQAEFMAVGPLAIFTGMLVSFFFDDSKAKNNEILLLFCFI